MTARQVGKLGGDIAIVGMSVCVPGASSTDAFWKNLESGIESIVPLDEEDLLAAGERPETLADPAYVRAAARLDGFDEFDAEFFGFSPKEAAILDPQHRKFLEVAWEAMESAARPPETIAGPVGVFAGCGMGSYFYFNICSNPGLVDDVGMFLLRHTGNDKDFLSTRVSHVFDLRGPSINIQTACSTSLVAVHYACKALRDGDCDMALAGGVTIELPQGRGYLYKENEILSPDGHCHAFDHRAQGTVFGSGAGAVALRRLEDAVADGDPIRAVIRGSAVNNDGAAKAGYLAPSIDGQAGAILQALDDAQVTADTIGYVECHGTGTYLGDPIEISALTEAYRSQTDATGFCRIGSVKTNIGHLDTAAGVAGLVKTALALEHRVIPPSLGYEAPNPAIDFATGPFRVNDRPSDWTAPAGPRRAAVNALGVGGTNAHVILEEAPERAPSGASDFPFQALCVSARSRAALDANCKALAEFLRAHPQVELADVAYTLKEGRHGFERRRVLVAETPAEAADLLESGDTRRVFTHTVLPGAPETVFMFPGGGAQYAGMGRDLYETEPVFAEWMDRGLDHLQNQLDYDIRTIWLPDQDIAAADARLQQPSVQLPLIMIVEYALAQLWISWGIRPAAAVGHSMGENTAACLAGVISFEDCIDLVLLRGRLFDRVPAGGMLSVSMPVAELSGLIGDDLDIASVNAPGLTAVSGPQAALDALSARLTERDIDHQRIPIDIAAHSRMLDPILDEFRDFLRGIDLSPPSLPVMSNRTGQVLTIDQATDPDYWVAQLRNTVMFADCIASLAAPNRVFLEVGPGKALRSLAQIADGVAPNQVLSSLRHPEQDAADDAFFLGVIARLWACGVEADWPQIWGESRRNRLTLPTYAFQRGRFFIEPGQQAASTHEPVPARRDDMATWGYRPVWRPRLAECDLDIPADLDEAGHQTWLVFEDECGLARAAADRLEQAGHQVVRVVAGDTYARLADGRYQIPPEHGRTSYDSLMRDLESAGTLPTRIAHFWLVTGSERFRPGHSFYDRNLEQGMLSLVGLAQAMSGVDMPDRVHMTVFTTGAAQVRDEPLPYPEKTMIVGPLGVIPREMPGLSCAWVDIEPPADEVPGARFRMRRNIPARDLAVTDRILEEMLAEPGNHIAAQRGDRRYGQIWKQTELPGSDAYEFRNGGTYLITGGFGGIGLTLADDLMRRLNANVILLGRDPLPPRDQWQDHLRTHGPRDRMSRRIQAVSDLEAIGNGRVLSVAADVCNIDQMRAAVRTGEAAFGALTGVIHAAGHINDAPVLAKTEADIQQVLAPKVSGLRVLDSLFPDGMLEVLVLCSSTSVATCPAGQVDYVAANEYLNAWARSRRHGATKVVAVDWGVWADIGMAADAMSVRRGGEQPTERVATARPLLQESGFDAHGNRIFATRLSTAEHWVLGDHRTATGAAIMPGTGYGELAAEALREHGVDGAFEIRDLYFFRPLHVGDSGVRDMFVRLESAEAGFAFSVHSATAGGYSLNAQASLHPLPAAAPETVCLDDIRRRCGDVSTGTASQRLRSPQEAHLRFGARWDVVSSTALGQSEGLARLSLPDSCRDDLRQGYLLHPGLLDLATGWAIALAPGYDGTALWVPVTYRSIAVLSPLPGEIFSWMRLANDAAAAPNDGFAVFDVTLTDPQGRVCVEVRGLQMKRTDQALDLSDPAKPDADAVTLGLEARGLETPLSPEEQRLHHNIAQGIRRDEGPAALRRALACGLPQVAVTSLPLEALIRQADLTVQQGGEAGQSFERPQLETDYVPPESDIEKTVAGLFESLLGVSQVGLHDSFFDLGGHSLIAVRLFAQINRAYRIEFPISVLFEAPSVGSIADLIAQRVTGTGTEAPAGDDGDGFSYLVPLHRSDSRQATPFFLVAGMFGNVLNLRHLALMLGRERSVYGLQARGLVGADEPHRSIQEAAADYINEMRAVQPQGPYLLGGFSGGGITAFEIARQLEQDGHQIALLAMLDTPLPVRPALTRRDKALIKLAEFRNKGPGYLREWMARRIEWERQKRSGIGPVRNLATGFNNEKVEQAFRAAVAAYRLQPWSGPMVLFRPPLDRHWKVSRGNWVSSEREYVFDDNNWRRWVPTVQVVEVPGDHDSMVLVPNVSVLAERLKSFVERAGTGTADDAAPASVRDLAAE